MVNNDFLMGYGAGKAAGGGGSTLITKTITTNGTYTAEDDNADGYSEVTVDVSGGGGISIDGLCMATEPSGEVVINATEITAPWPYRNKVITKITARNITGALPEKCFGYMTNLEYAVLPACAGNIGQTCFAYCSNMLGVDLKGGGVWSSLCFNSCPKLTTMVLRNTNTIQAASQSNMFSGNTISTTKPLHVYVPSALKSSYESATNWSTWVSANTVIFHAIEGSIYETQYVDGTPIS